MNALQLAPQAALLLTGFLVIAAVLITLVGSLPHPNLLKRRK